MSFINRNICKSFNVDLTTAPIALPDYTCSEVTLYNATGQSVLVWDDIDAGTTPTRSFLVAAGGSFTFRGITNAMQLSCATTTGSGKLYARAQFFSGVFLTH